MTPADTDHVLADIRQEIDRIDDGLVGLMLRRWAMSARVRDLKGGTGGMMATPYRPAREAQILRRLMDQAAGTIPAADLVRLWRVILSASIAAQATVTLHVEAALAESIESRLMIAEHFCGMPVVAHDGIEACLAAARQRPVDLAILDAEQPWAECLVAGMATGLSVAAALPSLLLPGQSPRLIVAASGEAAASGDDHTILLARHDLPAVGPLKPVRRWQSGDWTVTAVAGFPRQLQPLINALSVQHPELQLHVAGAVPAPLEVKS